MKKTILAALMTMMLIVSLVPASSFAAQLDSSSKGSITVNGAADGDHFSAYKVFDISYDENTNNVTYEFNSDFTGYFEGKNVELSDLDVNADRPLYPNDSKALNDLLADMPGYIQQNRIAPVKAASSADGSAVLDNLALGGYLIVPDNTSSVYQLMLQMLQPSVENESYIIEDVVINAKKSEVDIEKTADKKSVTKGEEVTYTISTDVPAYLISAANKNFEIKDTLQEGLTLKTSSVSVKLGGSTIDSGMYSLSTGDSGFTFSVSNPQYAYTEDGKVYPWLAAAEGNKKLVITYKAVLDNAASSDSVVAGYDNLLNNTAEYKYSTYPFDGSVNTKRAQADINSYIIRIDKYVKDHPENKLKGAKFDLYRTLRDGETADASDIPNTGLFKKQGILLESGLTTDENGSLDFSKYEANGDMYDYYLVETKAPSGYNLLGSAVKINFNDADVSGSNGIYTVSVANSTGLQLPSTGDEGALLSLLFGIMLMTAAVILFIARRERSHR